MIFNKSANGAEEIKGLLGFIQASINFNNYKTYIGLAERDVKKIIGNAVFSLAENHYQSDNYLLPEGDGSGSGSGITPGMIDELVQKIQLPVALYAYKMYAASNDLTHSDKGRQIFVGAEEKPAFEWMIRRDEENILDVANKAMEVLLEYLDEYVDYFPEWSDSDAYQTSKSLFINTAWEFDQLFPIDASRRLFVILAPMMKDIERKYIKPVLGKDDFDTLKASISSGDLDEADEDLLEYIKVPEVMLTMSLAVKRLSAQVLPSGIFQSYIPEAVSTDVKKAADTDVRTSLARMLETEGLNELKRLQEYIAKIDDAEYTPRNLTERHDITNKFFRA